VTRPRERGRWSLDRRVGMATDVMASRDERQEGRKETGRHAIIKSEGKSDGPVPEHDNEDVLGGEDQDVIF
jgi:hypothetical protein